jgi:oligopeptide/dipeptide ABC transporter ATP-binding protein
VSGETLMAVSDLVVEFRARARRARAVDGVSLEWRRGEILGLVGESGCGKSTLARALLGLVEPAGGSVVFDGAPAADRTALRGLRRAPTPDRAALRGLRRRVQMIFQDPYQTLNPRMRVRAIVAEPLVVQGVPAAEHADRVARALRDVGLDQAQFLDRYPHQLSGGQRQRVAIAAALVLEPEGLICDEPVSMLDVSVRAQILEVLVGLQQRRGLALLFITHDLSLAWALCDRLAVMYLGRVVEEGTAVDVIEHPRHPYTQALVAAVPAARPGARGAREPLSGELPDAAKIPSGCRFHPRCPRRFEPCDSTDPPLYAADGDDHRAACLLVDPARASAAASRAATTSGSSTSWRQVNRRTT